MLLDLAGKSNYPLLSSHDYSVDFALKVVQWSDSETVRLQLWDIAGECLKSQLCICGTLILKSFFPV